MKKAGERLVWVKGRRPGDVTLFYKGSMTREKAIDELKKVIKEAKSDGVVKKERFGSFVLFLVPRDYMLENLEITFCDTKDFEEMDKVFKQGFKYLIEV